jgi:tricorn protease-like protein
MRKIPTKNMWVHDVTVSPDGKTIAGACGSNGEVIFLWDAKTGEAKTKQKRHLGPVNKVAFLEDGQTVVAEAHFSHIVWPQGTGKEEYRVKLLSGADSSCYLNHATLAARIGKELILLNLPSGKEFKRFPIPDQMGKFTLSADNRWIAFHDPKSIEVWDLSTFKMLRRLRIDPTDVHLSPDGRVLVVRDNAHIYRCIDLDTQKEFWNLAAPYTRDCPVVFSPNGRMVAVPNKEQGFRLLEVTTGQDRLHLKGQTKEVSAFAFSHDGKTLASGDETTVRLWDLQNGKEMQILRGHVGTVRSVDFSPDGRKLVSGSDDLTALVWKIPPECQYQKPQVIHLGREEKDKLWGKLAAVDAAAAYAALQRLAAADADAVALCRERLFESPPTPPRQIERWIGQLDDEEFAIRDKATNNLERVEGDAKNALESALKRECSIEKKQRIEALLETLNAKQSFIRVIRAVELLEQIGTAEAVDVLRQLEKKTGDAAVRDDVRRSLDRLQAKQKSR